MPFAVGPKAQCHPVGDVRSYRLAVMRDARDRFRHPASAPRQCRAGGVSIAPEAGNVAVAIPWMRSSAPPQGPSQHAGSSDGIEWRSAAPPPSHSPMTAVSLAFVLATSQSRRTSATSPLLSRESDGPEPRPTAPPTRADRGRQRRTSRRRFARLLGRPRPRRAGKPVVLAGPLRLAGTRAGAQACKIPAIPMYTLASRVFERRLQRVDSG